MIDLSTFTLDDVMALGPCHARSWVERRFATLGRDTATALDVLTLCIAGQVTPNDCFWLVLREEWVPSRLLRLFACDCAERALTREREAGREPDPRSWQAVEVARQHADGQTTDAELAAARAAARAAAGAAGAAAWAAAGAAAGDAWDAAGDAAWDAAGAAAGDAERLWQIQHLREMLIEEQADE